MDVHKRSSELPSDDANVSASPASSPAAKAHSRVAATTSRTTETINAPADTTSAMPATSTGAVDAPPPTAAVVFGSNMGACEKMARILADSVRRVFAAVDVHSADAWLDEGSAPEVLFVVTSSYNGQPPDNARRFVAWLQRAAAGEPAAGDRAMPSTFAVFGLGDSNWRTYQAVPRHVDAAMRASGAVQLLPLGEGDDAADRDASFVEWREVVVHVVHDRFAATSAHRDDLSGSSSVRDDDDADSDDLDDDGICSCAVNCCKSAGTALVLLDDGGDATELRSALALSGADRLGAVECSVVSSRQLIEQPIKAPSMLTVHLDFELPVPLSYATGGRLQVFPRNDPALVDELVRRLQWSPDAVLTTSAVANGAGRSSAAQACSRRSSCVSQDVASALSFPVTLRDALLHCVDVGATPVTRSVLALLVRFAADGSDDQLRLRRLSRVTESAPSEPRLVDDYSSFVRANKLSLLDVLDEFPSVQTLPPAALVCALPRLAPRTYSISSASEAHERRVHLTVGAVQRHTPAGRVWPGVCSGYLAALQPGDTVVCRVTPPLPDLWPDVGVARYHDRRRHRRGTVSSSAAVARRPVADGAAIAGAAHVLRLPARRRAALRGRVARLP